MALQWVGDVFPVTYGHKAPLGFGGVPDVVQQRFNAIIHFSQWHHDATRDEIRAGMVMEIPADRYWTHWLAFNEVDSTLSDEEVLEMLAGYKAVLDAIGAAIGQERFSRRDYHARVQLRNEQVFDEWLVDYADRNGMWLESARANVLEEQKRRARSCGNACGPWHDDVTWRPVPELDEIDLSGIKAADPVFHDTELSFERIREDVENRKYDRTPLPGMTLRDKLEAGIVERPKARDNRSFFEIKGIEPPEGFDETYGSGYSTRKERLGVSDDVKTDETEAPKQNPSKRSSKSDRNAVKTAPKAKKSAQEAQKSALKAKIEPVSTPKGAPSAENRKTAAKNEPEAPKVAQKARRRAKQAPKQPIEEASNPLKGIVNPRPTDRSGWKGTRKRRSCVTSANAYDSAAGCMAIGAYFTRCA